MEEAVRWKGIVFAVLLGLVCSACAMGQALPRGRVGEVRGRIVQVEKDQGLIAVAANPDAEEQWFKLAPLTEVKGPGVSKVDELETGQRVYVRYLREPRADPPEVFSITVIKYTLSPKGAGTASFGTGF